MQKFLSIIPILIILNLPYIYISTDVPSKNSSSSKDWNWGKTILLYHLQQEIEQTGSYVTDTIILHITIKTNDVVPYKSVLILWKGITISIKTF